MEITKLKAAQKRSRISGPWKEVAKKPSWAYGVAGIGLILLAVADLVMLGDQIGQSFGMPNGLAIVVALLASFILIPKALAHSLHDVLAGEDGQAAAGIHAVKVIACVLLATSLVVGYAAVTNYRLSQAEANAKVEEQAIVEASSEDEISFSTAEITTTASPESQTILLTTILVISGIYSFALSWAQASRKESPVAEAIDQATPLIGIETEKAMRAEAESLKQKQLSLIQARKARDTYGVVLEGTKIVLNTVTGPEESMAAAKSIAQLYHAAAAVLDAEGRIELAAFDSSCEVLDYILAGKKPSPELTAQQHEVLPTGPGFFEVAGLTDPVSTTERPAITGVA